MKQIQSEILVGTSYAKTFAKAFNVDIPREIKRPADARFVSLAHESHANDKAVARAVQIINGFDDIAKDAMRRYQQHPNDLKLLNVRKILEGFKQGHESTGELIRVYESVLSGGSINPTTYLHAKRHFTIAKIFLDKFKSIDVDKVKLEDLELNEEREEVFRLGVFVGLEPILVTTIFSALERDDAELSQTYGKLVDRYAHMVAMLYPDEYIEATQLNKPSLSASAYSKFLQYVEAERHGQILL